MGIERLYRNSEIKNTAIKLLIISLVAILAIYLFINIQINKFNEVIINQNAAIINEIVNENKSTGELINNFYKKASNEDIEKGKEILNSYGYNEGLNLNSNEIMNEFNNSITKSVIFIIIVSMIITYLVVFLDYKNLFFNIANIAVSAERLSEGNYTKIKNDKVEGDISILIDNLNKVWDRIDNSITLLNEEKQYLKDYLADISHQLKTPLASLFMFNDLMVDEEDMEYEQRKIFLTKSSEQLERMEWLLLNLLKAGRLEADVINFNLKNESLRYSIVGAVNSLELIAKSKNININVNGDLNAKVIHDREWLKESISNIVKNAIEYTNEFGKISVHVIDERLSTKIIIEDNGSGIKKAEQKRIFDRFYKGDNSLNSINPKSIGIGLYLSKSIVNKMGGDIKVVSEEKIGTKFIITFIRLSQ